MQLQQLERLQTKANECVAKRRGKKKKNSSNASQGGFIEKRAELIKFRGQAPGLAGGRVHPSGRKLHSVLLVSL